MLRKAVILFSGGLDSTTLLYFVKSKHYDIYTLQFDYGQNNALELKKSKEIIKKLSINNKIFKIDLRQIGGSALTDDIDVPQYSSLDCLPSNIPLTYVPARNTIFLSIAFGYAETIGAFDIFIGVNSLDYGNYPDCRPSYINAYQNLINIATKESVENNNKINLHAPLINMHKYEIIKLGLDLGIDYSNSLSCYRPTDEGLSCGLCLSCIHRLNGFKLLNIKDPAAYV